MKNRIERAKLFYRYADFWGLPIWTCLRAAFNGFLGIGTLGK